LNGANHWAWGMRCGFIGRRIRISGSSNDVGHNRHIMGPCAAASCRKA
jgi:hypothetical protein